MKIGIVTCMWKRPEVFEIYAEGINRLRNEFDIVPLAVGSEGAASKALCKKYEFMYLERPNKPLGRKFNEGLRCFRNQKIDYAMIMGSDDLISNSLLNAYMPHMEKRAEVIGILDIYFYDLFKKSLHYWPGYGYKPADRSRKGEPIGMARCLSRDLLDRMKWNVWNESINKGLDWSMWQKIKARKIKPVTMTLKGIGAFGVDLKSELNICNQVLYDCERVDPDIMGLLSDEEQKMIKIYG